MTAPERYGTHPTAAGRDGVLLLVEKRRQPLLCGECLRESELALCPTCDAKLAAELGPHRRPGGRRA